MRHASRVAVVACLLVLSVVGVAAGAPGVAGDGAQSAVAGHDGDGDVCAGTIEREPDGVTVVSIQGARVGEDSGSGPAAARVVAYAPDGEVLWVHRAGREFDVAWSYDIDPTDDGNVFVTATQPEETLLYELNTTTGEREWVERLNFTDTHDADLLGDGRIAIANMRNHDGENDTNDDRIVVYDRHADEVVWEYRFERAFDPEDGGDYEDDWTHVNDVDPVGERFFLVSPRNMDSVLLIDRETKRVVRQLGADGSHDVLHKQHNPDYLQSDDGDDTFLVADSENDRIVEYEHTGLRWRRTLKLGSEATLSWPRDADRLPNGNTLIGDSSNDRVLEVTPDGEVVWEVYAPWLVYDAERIGTGDGSNGPTAADIDATGGEITGAAVPSTERREACADYLRGHEGGFGSAAGPPGTEDGVGSATSPAGTEGADRSTDEPTANTAPPGDSDIGVSGPLATPLTLLALAAFVALALLQRRSSRQR